jgi:hypothetical protein
VGATRGDANLVRLSRGSNLRRQKGITAAITKSLLECTDKRFQKCVALPLPLRAISEASDEQSLKD